MFAATRVMASNRELAEIYDGVCEVIAQHQPELLALEQLFSHYARPRTAILMGHARGVICLAAGRRKSPSAISNRPG